MSLVRVPKVAVPGRSWTPSAGASYAKQSPCVFVACRKMAAGVFPLIASFWQPNASGGYKMMLSIYVPLGVFVLLAARNPSANRSLIAFTAWSSLAHARRTVDLWCARHYRSGASRVGSEKAVRPAGFGLKSASLRVRGDGSSWPCGESCPRATMNFSAGSDGSERMSAYSGVHVCAVFSLAAVAPKP